MNYDQQIAKLRKQTAEIEGKILDLQNAKNLDLNESLSKKLVESLMIGEWEINSRLDYRGCFVSISKNISKELDKKVYSQARYAKCTPSGAHSMSQHGSFIALYFSNIKELKEYIGNNDIRISTKNLELEIVRQEKRLIKHKKELAKYKKILEIE